MSLTHLRAHWGHARLSGGPVQARDVTLHYYGAHGPQSWEMLAVFTPQRP